MGWNVASSLWRGNKGGARPSDLVRLQWRGKIGTWRSKLSANNICTRGRRERGLGVLGETTEDNVARSPWRSNMKCERLGDLARLQWRVELIRSASECGSNYRMNVGENVVWWRVVVGCMTWPKVKYTVTWRCGLWCNPVRKNHGQVDGRRVHVVYITRGVMYTWYNVHVV